MKRIISLILLTLSVSLFADQWRGIAVTSEDIPDNMIMFNRAPEGEIVLITSVDSGKSCRARVGGKAEDSKYVALLSQNVAQELNIDGNAAEIVIDTAAAAVIPAVQFVPEEEPAAASVSENADKQKIVPVQLYEILLPYVQNLPTIWKAACGSAYRHSINDIPLCFHDAAAEDEKNKAVKDELYIPQELSESLSAAFMADAAEEKPVKWVNKLERGKVYIKILSSANKNELENYSRTIAMFFNDSIILYESADMRYELLLGPIKEDNIGQSIRIVRGYGYKDAYLIRGK